MPSKYTDCNGRERVCDINLLTVRKMKADGFNFFTLDENGGVKLREMYRDFDMLTEWLYANIKAQAPTDETLDQFVMTLRGQSLWDAREAWGIEYENFTPNPEIRSALAKLRAAEKDIQGKAAAKLNEATDMLIKAANDRFTEMSKEMTPERVRAILDEQMESQLAPKKSNAA